MIPIILIFISLSLGTLTTIGISSFNYNLEYIEFTLLSIFFYVILKVWKVNRNIKINKTIMSLTVVSSLIFSYSILTFIWTDYGISVIPGAIPLLYAVITIIIGYYYLSGETDLYVLGIRVFILCLFAQLIVNILNGFSSGETGFYAVKAFATTFIGKSNFISFFFVFGLLYEFISKEKHWKFYLFLNLLAVVFTVSRGAIVSLVLSLMVFFVIAMVNNNFNKKNIIISYVALGSVFILFLILTPSGRELIGGLSLGLEASTVSSRQILWNEAFHEIAHNPLGIGVVWRNNPHNFFLDSLRNLGVFFGTIYILIIVSPLFAFVHPKVTKLSSRTIGVLVAYLSVVIHSLIEVFFFTKISVVWTFMTLSFILITIKKDLKSHKSYADLANQKYIFNNSLFEKIKKSNEGV